MGFPGGSVVKNPPTSARNMRFLVWEDPTCHRAAKPMCHKYKPELQSLGAAATKAPSS